MRSPGTPMTRFTTYRPDCAGDRKTTISPRRTSRYGSTNFAHGGGGANCSRFTNTWSPISSVFSIELEGISNACTMKVMMNNPVTNTPAREARNSTVVSRGFSSCFFSSFFLSVFGNLFSFCSKLQDLTHHAESPVPAGDLEQMGNRVRETKKFISGSGTVCPILRRTPHRPVDQ